MIREISRSLCRILGALCLIYIPIVLVCAPSDFGAAFARLHAVIATAILVVCITIRFVLKKERIPNQEIHCTQ